MKHEHPVKIGVPVAIGNLTNKRLAEMRERIRAGKGVGGLLCPIRIAREALGLGPNSTRGDVLSELNSRLRHVDTQAQAASVEPKEPSMMAAFIAKQVA